MDKKTISTMKKIFDDIMHTTEDGTVEFWYARELMRCLGYTTWRRFKDAINRAMESCKSAEIEVSDHFADAVKMVEIGSNAVRDVDDAGFGRIRSKGDQALFGGRSTLEMKEKLGVSDKRPLADFLPTLTIAAKNLATEMTNYNVEEKDLKGEGSITTEHVQNNTTVREMLGTRGIKPEELPPSEDTKEKTIIAKAMRYAKKIAREFDGVVENPQLENSVTLANKRKTFARVTRESEIVSICWYMDCQESLSDKIGEFVELLEKYLPPENEIAAFSGYACREQWADICEYKDENSSYENVIDTLMNESWMDNCILCDSDFVQSMTIYLKTNIETSLYSDNYLLRVFAYMDRRVGKRTLEKIKCDVEKMPEWVKQFYQIRCEADGIF